MLRNIVIACSLLVTTSVTAQVAWPAVTSTTRPWTRWWWEGSAVSREGLTENLTQYKKAGIGGVEITPIYGIHGYEKQFVDFLSPAWMKLFDHTLKEAKKMDMGVDLANGTGWPFGGPWVKDEDASKSVFYKTYSVKGGEQLTTPVEYKRESWVRTANYKTVSADTVNPRIGENKNLQALALDQIQFAGKLPLQTLMAYSSGNETIDLTKLVDKNGKLNWTAPAGQWELYALFEGLHGKMVERAAPGGEGYAIDHFSSKAAKNYFKKFDTAFRGYDISYLRAFFNDSYEVDDARGQSNWTPELFNEFNKRKGYDLRKHLPALFGKKDAVTNSRVMYDYRSVIDELLLEHFTREWKKWGTGKGAMLRNQSHGSPANTLDLYSVVDIPETEGTDILRFKFATSATNVMGKKLAASESATWLNEHFLSSWGDVKKSVDLYFLGGVNHIVYHGTAYSPKEIPWPGWLFYAAVHFQPTNPQWKDFATLNQYVTRAQSFLQAGKPDNDVLLYYPIVDRYSTPGTVMLQHFDGMERNFENTDFEHVSKEMLEKGYSFDFFSDRQLQQFTVNNKKIMAGGNAYTTILLPNNEYIPEASMEKILALAAQGATIIFYKNPPRDVPGYDQLEKRQARLKAMKEKLKFTQADKSMRAVIGKGMAYTGNDLEAMLNAAKVRQETMTATGLKFIRRQQANGHTYFISNHAATAIEEWVPVTVTAATIALFDPMRGNKGLAKTRKNNGRTEVFLQLQPHESIIIRTYNKATTSNNFPYKMISQPAVPVTGTWTIKFLEGGPVIPATAQVSQLGSWTNLDGEEVRNFSGTASYQISFNKPAGNAGSYLLDLGKVNETAEVFINGKRIGTVIGPVFQLVIPASQLQPVNKLEIIVASLMANRIIYMDKNAIPWKIFYNTNMPARKKENVKDNLFSAAHWNPLPSGLSGPVTITPLK